MQQAFYRPSLLPGEETISVTRAERDWLYDERIKAMRECPLLDFQRDNQSASTFWLWICALRIYRRDRDGSLIAKIIVKEREGPQYRTRKLRTPHTLGSTSIRDVRLRRTTRRR